MHGSQDRKAREAELDKSLKSQDATKFQLEDTLAFKRGQQVQEQYAAQLQEVRVIPCAAWY